jgi:hypothetical protein
MSEAAETAEVNGHGNEESSAEVKEEVKVKEENGENNSAHNTTTSNLGQITLSGTLGYSSTNRPASMPYAAIGNSTTSLPKMLSALS